MFRFIGIFDSQSLHNLDCVFRTVVYVSVRRAVIMAVYLIVLSALYLVPLGLYSPCIKEKGTLGPAPALIGHRGAPMVRKYLMRREMNVFDVWKQEPS